MTQIRLQTQTQWQSPSGHCKVLARPSSNTLSLSKLVGERFLWSASMLVASSLDWLFFSLRSQQRRSAPAIRTGLLTSAESTMAQCDGSRPNAKGAASGRTTVALRGRRGVHAPRSSLVASVPLVAVSSPAKAERPPAVLPAAASLPASRQRVRRVRLQRALRTNQTDGGSS